MDSHFLYKHTCLIEKNVPLALILPSRWQDGAENLGIETTSCLWYYVTIYRFRNLCLGTKTVDVCKT